MTRARAGHHRTGSRCRPEDPGPATSRHRYVGDSDIEPSMSARFTFTVEPALVPGPVAINGGASTTSDPSSPWQRRPRVPSRCRSPATWTTSGARTRPSTTRPARNTWLTAPWYGDDADGVRTIWVRWADALGRWSAWSSDTIVLDRGVQGGTVTINGGAGRGDDAVGDGLGAGRRPGRGLTASSCSQRRQDVDRRPVHSDSIPWTRPRTARSPSASVEGPSRASVTDVERLHPGGLAGAGRGRARVEPLPSGAGRERRCRCASRGPRPTHPASPPTTWPSARTAAPGPRSRTGTNLSRPPTLRSLVPGAALRAVYIPGSLTARRATDPRGCERRTRVPRTVSRMPPLLTYFRCPRGRGRPQASVTEGWGMRSR